MFDANLQIVELSKSRSTVTNIIATSKTPVKALAEKKVIASRKTTFVLNERLSKTNNLFVIYAKTTDKNQEIMVAGTFFIKSIL